MAWREWFLCSELTAKIKLSVSKDLVASNKRYRHKRPQLKIVVNNPPRDTAKEEAA